MNMNIEPTIAINAMEATTAYENMAKELNPLVKRSAVKQRRQDREAAIKAYYTYDVENAVEKDVHEFATVQSVIKRHPDKAMRRACLLAKRANTRELLGIDLVAENAHPHGSRAMRRKVSHEARKGTKPSPDGHGSVRLTAIDLVDRYGRTALHVMERDVFDKSLAELNASGRRLDLKAKTAFQNTVDALSDIFSRRVSA